MSLLFNNVELLGYTHQNNFFGEKSFNYSVTKTISLRGFTLNLVNNNSIQPVLSAITSIKNGSKDFINVTINNINYGIGKITELSFDNDNWLNSTRFNATIVILEEVPLVNISSQEFTGLNLSGQKFNLLKSFSETFTLDFDTQNKILGGEHSLEIQYDADNKNINLINLAQSLATQLLKSLPSNLIEGNYTERTKYKLLHSENYNLIDGKCGFNKKFSYKTENTDQPYSVNITHSIELGENGIVTVSENGEIKAEYDKPSLYENALEGYNEQIVNTNTRITSFFNNYKTKFSISENLNPQPIQRSTQINKFLGTINYTISFDNDLKKKNPKYIYEYVSVLDRNEQGIWNASENGTINGIGLIGSDDKYKNAEEAWSQIKSLILNRVTSFYNAEAKERLSGSNNLKELSKNTNREKYNGRISYTYTYTDDPTIKDGSDMGIRKINVEKSDTGIMPLIKNFLIPNKTYALIQNREFKKQGTYTVKATLEIGCFQNVFNGIDYFNKAKNAAGPFGAQGNDNYLESVSFSSDEIEKTVTYEAVYKYS
jgi:hypothetical protein